MAQRLPNVRATVDRVKELRDALLELTKTEVLVGYPEDGAKATRKESGAPTNAELAYIHDNGAPEANIPARPFMLPGMEEAAPEVADILGNGLIQVVRRRSVLVAKQYLTRAGIKASTTIKKKINEGVPPPLADSTLAARAKRGRKGAKKELELRSRGIAPSTEFAKPLVDTDQMRNALTYVLRDRKKRR